MKEREVLELLKGKGVTGVLFKEQTLVDLEEQGQAWTTSGSRLAVDPGYRSLPLRMEYTYFLTRDAETYRRLYEQLKAKTSLVDTFWVDTEGVYLVGSPLPSNVLKEYGLGFPERALRMTRELGLNALVQIKNWPEVTDYSIRASLQALEGYEHISAVLFNDRILPGYPDKLNVLADEVRRFNAPVGLIEFYTQQGLSRLAWKLDKNAVRLHSISQSELGKMSPRQAIDRYLLAVTDRNVRVLFVRFFSPLKTKDWLEDNLNYIGQLTETLKKRGFELGAARPFRPLPVSRIWLFCIGLGGIAGGMLLLELIGWSRLSLLLGGLAVLVWAILLAGGQVAMGRKIMALGISVVFPTLAVAGLLGQKPSGIWRSVGLLVLTSLTSMAGAFLIVGLLRDVGFMLKLDQFAGVKLSFLAPPLLLFFVFLIKYREKEWLKWFYDFLEKPVTVKLVLLFGFLALVGVVYINRSGNETALVSGIELKVRSLLQEILIARPRTKEFLIGHPLLLTLFYLGYRERWLPLLLLGSIGQVSLINTFAHIHTPLAVSLLRTFNGLWLGIIAGLILIALYRRFADLGSRYRYEKE